ncbi:SusC/RagA family TonB-linked outer membrane protein [Filimonas effusa]|nr:SusC/RagA family TonB-linked outer membrane protein [Filimonas effusa]
MTKLTFLLVFIASLQVGARSIGQTMTASFKNTSLGEVFKEVEKQTGFTFVFSRVQMEKAGKITASFKGAALQQVLKEIFKDQPFTYQLSDKFIVVQQRSAAGLSASLTTMLAPPDVIKGKVTDESGKPVAGASVVVKGTMMQTFTNDQGEFTLKNISTEATLIISAINIETREVPLKGRSEITLVTKAKIYALEDISVGNLNYGYGTISKERAAGAFGQVTAKEMQETPTIGVVPRLEGLVPGLKVDARNNKLQIRTINGFTTVGSEPLVVIDGFPQIPVGDVQSLTKIQSSVSTNNALLSYINPNDIETITFLKDASATSIWGSKGANGVIVIETKKGRKNKASVSFSTNIGVSRPADLNKLNWMSSAQYIDLEQELVDKSFITDPLAFGTPSVYTPNNSEASEWMYKYKRGTISLAERDAQLARLASYDSKQQVKDYMMQNAVAQQYNLSVSGGGDNNTYYISAGYTNDKPVFKNNSAKSANFTANFTSDLIKNKLTFRTGINYQYAVSKSNDATANALSALTSGLRPYDLLVDESGNSIKREILMRPELTAGYVAKGYLPFTYSALDELNYTIPTGKENRIRLNTGFTYKVTEWLNAEIAGSFQNYSQNLSTIGDLNSYDTRRRINYFTSVGTNNKLAYGIPVGAIYTMNESNGYDYNGRAQLNFNKRFKGDHQVVALAAAEVRETYSKGYGTTRYGYDPATNTAGTVNPTVATMTMWGWTEQIGNPVSGITENKSRYLSYLGNFSYIYKDKYIFTGSARFDDNTFFGLERSKRAKPFWSAGFRWNALKENFMRDVKLLNDLSVRLSLGTAGAVPLAGNNIPIIAIFGVDSRTQQPYGSIQSPANQQLGWELTKTLNAGINFAILNSRIKGTFDIYKKWSNGIAVSLPYNATYGWSNVYFNSGNLRSHGLEFGITGEIIRKKDWSWSSTLNFSYGTNKVTDSRFVNNSSTLVPSSSQPLDGMPMGSLFAYKWAGLDATGQTQIYDKNKNIIKSTSGLPSTFTRDDLQNVGVSVAPYYGGYFNSVRYKSFELGVRISYYFGHSFFRPSVDNYPTYTGYTGVLGRLKDIADRWKNPGDEAKTNVPGLSNITFNSLNRYRYSDIMVEKADNIRLQQVSLSYSFPERLLPRNAFKSLSVNASARNLGLIWTANKKGLDPEYLSTGNYSALPPATNFVFGLNASF